MKTLWPFTLFPSTSEAKEEHAPEETVVEATVEEVPEAVSEDAPLDEDIVIDEDEIFDAEDAAEAEEAEEIAEEPAEEDDDDDDSGDYDDLAFALEVDLEEAARIETAKAHKRNKIAVASLAILGAAGLATGFALRAYFKKRK